MSGDSTLDSVQLRVDKGEDKETKLQVDGHVFIRNSVKCGLDGHVT